MVHVPSFDNIIIFNLFGIISFVKTESDFEHLNAKVFLFITILLTASVVLFTSCVLAAVITTDNGDMPS
jgi:hypothetical protein